MIKKALVKISGYYLSTDRSPIDHAKITKVAQDIKNAIDKGVKIAIVVGGGNICRGGNFVSVDYDYVGMLATAANSVALSSALIDIGVKTEIMSAIEINQICQPFSIFKARESIESGRVVVFAAGLGIPYITTDTCSVVRGSEIGCDVVLKATNVDGVYTKDPNKFDDAEFIPRLTYDQCINDKIGIMDAQAIAMARSNKMPIAVFDINQDNSIVNVIFDKQKYSLIST